MKLLIASDIHGSFYYCSRLVEAFKKEGADKLVLLGDILYHGPRNPLPQDYSPPKVAELLNSYRQNILCVKGNCDSEVDQMVLEFPIMAEFAVMMINNRLLYFTHGHKTDDMRERLNKGDILIHGHTHLSVCEELQDYTYLNPGSVSLPKDNIHGYMVIDENRVIFKDIDGNPYRNYTI